METILSSPRSSSGYGSSEEDHAYYGLTTTSSSGSAPQTPDSLSPLSSDLYGSDINVDLQSVFEDDDIIMPDFSDLSALVADANELYYLADEWSTVTTPSAHSPETTSWCELTPEDVDHLTQATAESPSESNILVSLLKRNSELDWLPTTTWAANDRSDCSQLQKQCNTVDETVASESSGSPASSQSTATCGPKAVVQSSPLQRLKALTHGNIVNNTELPGRTRIVINASNSPPTVVRQPLQSASPASSSAGKSNTVIRVGVAGDSHFAATVSRPVRTPVLASSVSQGTSTKGESPVSRSSKFTVAAAAAAAADVDTTANSTPSSEPRARRTPSVTMTQSAAGTRSAPIAIRRPRSELDDHRYSTLLPVPMSSASAAVRRAANSSTSGATKRPNRSVSTYASCVSRNSNAARRTGSSMLETLLLTNKTLRPNDGSEASLAACGVWSSSRCNSTDSSELSSSGPQPKRSCSEAPGSLLEHLLTGRTDESMNAVRAAAAVIPKTEPVEEDIVVDEKLVVDSFGLFSEHLLCDDTHGMNLGGLFGEDVSSATWTPACFDDRVFSTELEEIMHQEVRQEDAWLHHYLSDLL